MWLPRPAMFDESGREGVAELALPLYRDACGNRDQSQDRLNLLDGTRTILRTKNSGMIAGLVSTATVACLAPMAG